MKEAGIQAIIQKINAEAKDHSDARFDKFKSEIDKDTDNKLAIYRDELSKRREMLENHNKHSFALMLDRVHNRYNRELLSYRSQLIDDIFIMATQKLINASQKEFEGMFLNSVKGLKGEFTLYMGELSKGKLDASIIEKCEELNENLKISLSPDYIPGKSGFLINDARVEYNCLFEDIMEDKKNEQSNLILKEVFADLLD